MIDYTSLFPKEDILTKEIESWKCFVSSLSSKENRESFNNMLNDCYKYFDVINAKGQPFPDEAESVCIVKAMFLELWINSY